MSIVRTKALSASAAVTALALAGYFEGHSLIAYLDPIGKPTICRGITSGVKIGQIATEQECSEKEEAAMRVALETVSRCAGVPLSANEYAAYGSFTFNVGPGKKNVKDGFCILKNGKQPTMLRLLKSGEYKAACHELMKWTHASGIRFHGLVKRRTAERDVCLGGSGE